MTEQNTVHAKKTRLFYTLVVIAVCVVHMAVFYCVARYAPAKFRVAPAEKINTMEMVQLSAGKPVPIETQKPSQTHPDLPDQPKKNELRQKNTPQELTAPKKAPEKQLAAKAHEDLKAPEQAKVAQTQPVQTTRTDKPAAQVFSATSLAGGNANQTVGKGKEATGTATESTAAKVGKEGGGSGGGAKDRSAATISINKYYPEDARRQNVTGVVMVKVIVGINGRAKNTSIISSTDARLSAAGKKAAALARYRPAIKNGKPAEDTIAVKIIYDLTS